MLSEERVKLLLKREDGEYDPDADDADYNLGRISALKDVLGESQEEK